MSAAPAVPPPPNGPPLPVLLSGTSLLAKLVLAVLGGFLVMLSVHLWPDWRHNPDLSHGLLMPVVFLILLHESRSVGPHRWLRPGILSGAGLATLLVAGLLALGAAGLYAAAIGWTHAVVNFMLMVSLALLLGAALMAFSSETARLVPFNWSACTAVALWLLCAPIPPGTYSRLTLGLQLRVTENVLHALHVLGIAAARHGNVIELARGAVGIEEACSGVRSLISCVFAGLFFSATLVRRPWARALIIGLSAPLALLMNFIRSLTLTLLAANGTNISGTWHDATGFAVLGATAVLLGGLALLLERGEKKSAPNSPPSALDTPFSAPGAQLKALAVGLALALALTVVFVLNTRPAERRDAPVPDLLAVLPSAPAGWIVETSTDLRRYRDVLQTDTLAQRTYTHLATNGHPDTQIILYLAYWRPGQASVSQVASHTPDACWPGSGWESLATPQTREQPVVAGRPLATAEYRFFKNGDFPQYVWFWHLFDRQPIAYRDPYSAGELLRTAWHYGFRRDGAQLFVRVSSNRPWAEIVNEPLLAEFFAHTQSLGL